MQNPDNKLELLVNIDVDDLVEAERFYCDALGLTVGRRLGHSAVELLGAGSRIYLLLKAAGTRAFAGSTEARAYFRHWTPVHLDVVVEDVAAAVEKARAAGATLEVGIDTRPWGRIAMMSDPFGHGFCLIEFRGRGYDEMAG